MKTALILFLALMTGFVSAMPARHPYRKPLKPARVVETNRPVSWKAVAAAGAAATGVVAAYKIGSGVEVEYDGSGGGEAASERIP